ESASERGGLWGEVALEVRCPAYLRDVQITPTVSRSSVDLRATGWVCGASAEPLDLFLLLEGKALVHHQVEPGPLHKRFELLAPGLDVQRAPEGSQLTARLYKARVDLVHGTIIWYGVEKTVTFSD